MRKIVFITVTLLVFQWAPLAQASTIRISNPKIELELAPGETTSGEIVAENPDSEEVKAKIYTQDWVYAPGGTGEKKFSPAGTTPLSASKWITFTPSEAPLPPFGRITARYTLTVPKDAKGAYFSVLFFETLLGTSVDEEGVNVLVAGRIGALFLVHVKGASEKKGEVTAVHIEPPQGNKPMEISTTFHNEGNVDVTLGGTFLMMDGEGKVLGRGELNKIYTFPGVTEIGLTKWVGRLPKGSYQVLLTYDMGQGQSLVKEETLNIS